MPSTFANETLKHRRYPTVNDYGKQRINYDGDPEEHDVAGCWYEPLESTRDDDGQVLTVTAYRVAMPYETDVIARDVLLIDGFEYIADGDAQQVKSPSGALNQALVTVRRWVRGG